MKVRQDAWTEENDLLLAETVLRHVREGSTQLNAFEEVGDRLDRTSAACGFRWNAVVRHQYEKALQLAKKQRKQRQRILGKDQGGKKKLLYSPPVPTLEDIGALPETMEVSAELTDVKADFESMNLLESLGSKEAMDSLEDMLIRGGSEQGAEAGGIADSIHAEDAEPAEAEEKEMEPVAEEGQTEAETKDEENNKAAIAADEPQPAAPRYVQSPQQGLRLTLGHVIAYLQNLNSSGLYTDIYKSENERLKREILGLRKENEELRKKVSDLEQNSFTMQEDYETLMKIMNRARKLVLFDEEDRSATKFKMDRNGNLEKVAE
ncbi:RsfA family transcriptional regulator [Mesobacillus zeae]|uniref:RsfA family transcriptional regulator n=1 Tax=Mesobacillus zeae TaxID=1917180 RepID=A0A398BBB2_9BACI|nr:RsfA family transcriptional regulator [Mesobacillus zeae]RID86854.1 RsfA family transcriptional regulator [Mesobacillus zeae]